MSTQVEQYDFWFLTRKLIQIFRLTVGFPLLLSGWIIVGKINREEMLEHLLLKFKEIHNEEQKKQCR